MTRGTLVVVAGIVLGAGGLLAAWHDEKHETVRTLSVRDIAEMVDGKKTKATMLEVTLAAVESTYAGARVQSDRARRVQHDLERSFPQMPVCTVERVHPPPTGLEELLAMGRILLG